MYKKEQTNMVLDLVILDLVNFNVALQKQSVSAKVTSYRKYKSINKEAFLTDLRVSLLGYLT